VYGLILPARLFPSGSNFEEQTNCRSTLGKRPEFSLNMVQALPYYNLYQRCTLGI
jgi:hypothetical protein